MAAPASIADYLRTYGPALGALVLARFRPCTIQTILSGPHLSS